MLRHSSGAPSAADRLRRSPGAGKHRSQHYPARPDGTHAFCQLGTSLPHLDDQVINRYIKEIAQAAGLAENLKVVKKLTDKYYYFK